MTIDGHRASRRRIRGIKPGEHLRAEDMEYLFNFVDRFQVTGAADFEYRGRTPRLNVRGSMFPWDKISFGFTKTGSNFTVKAGTVFRGRSFVNVADTTVPVSGGTAASPHYVYLRFPVSDLSSAEIADPPLASMPTPNDTYWQVPLYACYYDGVKIVIVQYHNFGNIYVPGQFDD